jgi:crossover junction endodeoxyribonuclease RuvC
MTDDAYLCMNIVIGIDPGYGRCGFSIIEEVDRSWKCVTHGVFTTSKEQKHADRLVEIADDFQSIVDTHHPGTMVIEEIFFSKSTTTAMKVAEVRGMLIMLARRAGLEVIQVKPNEVKLALTGYGRADKKQVQEMVKTVFELDVIPKPDDAADALAVAWTGANRISL